MNARFTVLFVALFTTCAQLVAGSEERLFDLTVNAGGHARSQSLAMVTLDLPGEITANPHPAVQLMDAQGTVIPAQMTRRSLLSTHANSSRMDSMELHFVAPDLHANGSCKLTAIVKGSMATGKTASFAFFADEPGVFGEYRFDAKPVLRFMYEALDESTPERRAETYKVYHHVFAPSAGTTQLTKGPGGLYPHHRGLFYGFNRISYGAGRKADTWHCTDGADQSFTGTVSNEAGPIMCRHRVHIDWHGQEKEVFAKEQREMGAYHFPGGTLIEFASRLQSTVGPVKLDGDPQHAGFQFRAAQEVADVTNKQTYYIRPFGQGAPGETLNWPEAKEMVNLPWHAMSCVIGGDRYTIAMLDRPVNPKESRFSERDYGRFGSYFEYDLDEHKPLDLNYRVWVQAGEMNAEEIEAKSNDFINPVTVTVTPR